MFVSDDIINMSYWNTDPHLMNTNDVTPQQRVINQSAGYHVIPTRDEFYWERECDEALSLRSESSVSPCEDFVDVIVNVNQCDNHVKSQNDEDTNCVNLTDKSNPTVGGYKNYILSNDVTPLHGRHQLNADHLVAESSFQDTSCQDIGDPCNGIRHTHVHHKRISQLKAKIAFMTKEVGLHNISKQYFNTLNVVLSVKLVVCCVVGIGLFLLYMLSCDG